MEVSNNRQNWLCSPIFHPICRLAMRSKMFSLNDANMKVKMDAFAWVWFLNPIYSTASQFIDCSDQFFVLLSHTHFLASSVGFMRRWWGYNGDNILQLSDCSTLICVQTDVYSLICSLCRLIMLFLTNAMARISDKIFLSSFKRKLL